MKPLLCLVVLVAFWGIVLCNPVRTPGPNPFQYRNIERIRGRQPHPPHARRGFEPFTPQSLRVLSRLAQTEALRPRRRNFKPRSDYQSPLPSESKPTPLPLEPPPKPLPLEKLPKFPVSTYQRNPHPPHYSPPHDIVPYRPRPEFGHQRIETKIKSQDLQGLRISPQEDHQVLPHLPHGHNREFKTPSSRRPQESKPSTYRQRPETPQISSNPEKGSVIYSERNPFFHQEASGPRNSPPHRLSLKPNAKRPAPEPSPFPRTTKHRNRPQFSGEYQKEVGLKSEMIRNPPQPSNNEDHLIARQKLFESIRNRDPIESHPSLNEDQDVILEKPHDFPKPSVRQRPWRVDKTFPVKRGRTKSLKKKKLSYHHTFSLPKDAKDLKKDKRGILSGHLDKNGVEFVEEAAKIERGNKNGRMLFQIHGQQGPHSYKFGYDTGKGPNRQFRFEERDAYGEVKGRYGYHDKHGKLQIVNYSAHPKYGFSADLPKY